MNETTPNNEPIDVQKMLAAYGAELDELRVWCRKQEERIAELEKQLALETAHRRTFNSATREMFGQHGERLAALEAQPAPAPEYAPGWTEGNGIYGMRVDKSEGYDVMIAYNAGSDVARITVFGYSENDNQSAIAMKNDLLRLRDNITEVLKRMEMGVE